MEFREMPVLTLCPTRPPETVDSVLIYTPVKLMDMKTGHVAEYEGAPTWAVSLLQLWDIAFGIPDNCIS